MAQIDPRRKLQIQKVYMRCWRGEKYWLGRLVDHPEIMSQGESLEELEENLADAFQLMALDAGQQRQLVETGESH